MAKKAQSTLINMLLSLIVIAIVAAAVLALVSAVTKEPIAAAEAAKKEAAIKKVLPDFATLEEKEIDGTACNYGYNANHELVGVAVEASSEKGFGGKLGVMVGFNTAGDIYGYEVLQTNETPGLGAKAGTWFQKEGKGCVIGKNPGAAKLSVKKDGGDIDAISGSTITSRAFCEAVNNAYDTYEKGADTK